MGKFALMFVNSKHVSHRYFKTDSPEYSELCYTSLQMCAIASCNIVHFGKKKGSAERPVLVFMSAIV